MIQNMIQYRQYCATLYSSVCIRHMLMFNSVHIIEETSYRNTWFCNQRLNYKVVLLFSYIAVTLLDKKVIYEHLKIKQIPAISYKTILEVHQDMTQSLKNFTEPRGIK